MDYTLMEAEHDSAAAKNSALGILFVMTENCLKAVAGNLMESRGKQLKEKMDSQPHIFSILFNPWVSASVAQTAVVVFIYYTSGCSAVEGAGFFNSLRGCGFRAAVPIAVEGFENCIAEYVTLHMGFMVKLLAKACEVCSVYLLDFLFLTGVWRWQPLLTVIPVAVLSIVFTRSAIMFENKAIDTEMKLRQTFSKLFDADDMLCIENDKEADKEGSEPSTEEGSVHDPTQSV